MRTLPRLRTHGGAVSNPFHTIASRRPHAARHLAIAYLAAHCLSEVYAILRGLSRLDGEPGCGGFVEGCWLTDGDGEPLPRDLLAIYAGEFMGEASRGDTDYLRSNFPGYLE